jgi:hypothetical protein
MAQNQIQSTKSKKKTPAGFASSLDDSPAKGKNTRGTKGEQMRIDPEAHGLVTGRKTEIKVGAKKKAKKSKT